MKSICIVDNKTHVRESLIAFLEQYTDDITIVNYDNIEGLSTNSYDIYILSGSSEIAVHDKLHRFNSEYNRIQKCKKPIIGICLGAQLLANYYGGSIKKGEGIVHGEYSIQTNIFGEKKIGIVDEEHNRIIDTIGGDCTEYGTSLYGIEVFKHNIYSHRGLQFHPEHSTSFSDKIWNFIWSTI